MKPLIIANWKCNPETLKEAEKLFSDTEKNLRNIRGAEVVVCPPFVFFQKSRVFKLGAQNCFWENKGAYTGEVSPSMARDTGCEYVIIGHSERRKHFKEDNKTVNKKMRAALKAGLRPIMCVGETQEERAKGEVKKIIENEIKLGLADISANKLSNNTVIAYEPIWAIGSGIPCDPEEAQKMKILIMKTILDIYGPKVAEKVPVLYGGSVKSDNAEDYVKKSGLNGLLVGGASLDAEEFAKIVESCI